MLVAVTGIKGQLGTELRQVLEPRHKVIGFDLPEHDIRKIDFAGLIEEVKPDVVIHGAAMTHVDGCELDPDAAFSANAIGTRNVALGCQRAGADMLYVSTNEVFDGTKKTPYLEFDSPNPINMYGRSKLAGERYVQSLLDRHYIVRTAWVFGPAGNNFVKKILSVARETGQLRVVTDETGSPTYAKDLALAISRLIETRVYGTYHFVNEGVCSRYDFAREILAQANLEAVNVEPITAKDFTRPSTPPPYSPLRNFCGADLGINLRPWQEALADYIRNI